MNPKSLNTYKQRVKKKYHRGKNRNSIKKRVSIHSSALYSHTARARKKVDAGHTNKNNEIRIAVAIIDLFPIHFEYFFPREQLQLKRKIFIESGLSGRLNGILNDMNNAFK